MVGGNQEWSRGGQRRSPGQGGDVIGSVRCVHRDWVRAEPASEDSGGVSRVKPVWIAVRKRWSGTWRSFTQMKGEISSSW